EQPVLHADVVVHLVRGAVGPPADHAGHEVLERAADAIGPADRVVAVVAGTPRPIVRTDVVDDAPAFGIEDGDVRAAPATDGRAVPGRVFEVGRLDRVHDDRAVDELAVRARDRVLPV